MPPLPDNGPLFSVLEYAPGFVKYALHFPYGFYLAAKYRSASLPAISNPSIVTGGIAGESKTDLYALVGPYAKRFFAPFITVHAGDAADSFRTELEGAGITYPLVAKPDIGRNGRGVKIIEDEAALMKYLRSFPADVRMVLQRYVSDEGEAGVFYVRKPSETHGRITSLTLKYFPEVTGDGRSTLRELITRDPRASKIAAIYFRRNKRDLDRIIPEGARHRLVSVGNHVRGSLFINGEDFITPEMTAAFDRISKDIKDLYFGRFDVRFADIHDLSAGKDFTILEYNGASSEPTHVWDRRTSMRETYRELLAHWRYAFEIGAEHRARGVPVPKFWDLVRVWREEEALIQRYPDEE